MRIFCALILFVGLCHGVSKASQCSSYGRFPNNEAEDCRGYTVCLIGGITNFTQYKLTCPVGFVYSHFEQQCTNATGYKCFDSYNCSAVGNFAGPNNEDCRSFVTCIEGVDGIASARLVDCPPDTLFNINKEECVNMTDYSCSDRPTSINNVTTFVNASVILYDFSANTNNVHSSAKCRQVMPVFWLLLIFWI